MIRFLVDILIILLVIMALTHAKNISCGEEGIAYCVGKIIKSIGKDFERGLRTGDK